MATEITGVRKWSTLYFKGIRAGDRLISINGHEINDFLDYQFYLGDDKPVLEIEHKGKSKKITLGRKEQQDTGLEFESYLMDKQKRCRNKCIFCFIDQNPEGMRETIYFKDDDSRLSFLFGNYITLTNLTDKDIDRIIEMHISPVNISVHTMNKDLRVKMMNNKKAGQCLDYIDKLAEAGIEINTQLVLCPGINDADELRYSLEKLGGLFPAVRSIACVPVGVTRYREGLFEMPEYTKETASEVIETVNEYGNRFKENYGTRLVYAADEFYLKAEREIPGDDYYEAYPQIENGVGMWNSLKEEFLYESKNCSQPDPENHLSVATGVAAYPLMKELAEAFMKKYNKSRINVFEIKNDFFGHSITVAGLITGKDLINQLRDKPLDANLAIPCVMLRSEGDLFLDSISTQDVEKALGVSLKVNDCTGGGLFRSFMGQY